MPPKKKTTKQLEAEAKEAMIASIRDSLIGWYAGKWAELVAYGAACHCGLRGSTEPCPRHSKHQN